MWRLYLKQRLQFYIFTPSLLLAFSPSRLLPFPRLAFFYCVRMASFIREERSRDDLRLVQCGS